MSPTMVYFRAAHAVPQRRALARRSWGPVAVRKAYKNPAAKASPPPNRPTASAGQAACRRICPGGRIGDGTLFAQGDGNRRLWIGLHHGVEDLFGRGGRRQVKEGTGIPTWNEQDIRLPGKDVTPLAGRLRSPQLAAIIDIKTHQPASRFCRL